MIRFLHPETCMYNSLLCFIVTHATFHFSLANLSAIPWHKSFFNKGKIRIFLHGAEFSECLLCPFLGVSETELHLVQVDDIRHQQAVLTVQNEVIDDGSTFMIPLNESYYGKKFYFQFISNPQKAVLKSAPFQFSFESKCIVPELEYVYPRTITPLTVVVAARQKLSSSSKDGFGAKDPALKHLTTSSKRAHTEPFEHNLCARNFFLLCQTTSASVSFCASIADRGVWYSSDLHNTLHPRIHDFPTARMWARYSYEPVTFFDPGVEVKCTVADPEVPLHQSLSIPLAIAPAQTHAEFSPVVFCEFSPLQAEASLDNGGALVDSNFEGVWNVTK